MLKKIMGIVAVVHLAAMLMPSEARAYGAVHVGYTHVGPNGVYHTGETAVAGPRGDYAAGRTSATGYGGAEYRGGAAYGVERGGVEYRGGAAYGTAGGYRYVPSYGGAAAAGTVHYGYIR